MLNIKHQGYYQQNTHVRMNFVSPGKGRNGKMAPQRTTTLKKNHQRVCVNVASVTRRGDINTSQP